MNICVVGAGATGSVLIQALAAQKKVERIICIVKDRAAARRFLKPSQKIKVIMADVKKDLRKLVGQVQGAELVINAASPWLNIPIMKLALAVNAHYQDMEAFLGFDDGVSRMPYRIEHLKFQRKFKETGKIAVFDTGAAPGLTNLLVAEIADRFGRLERLTIRLLEETPGSAIVSTWSPQALIDEIYSRPVAYRNGRFVLQSRFSSPGVPFRFPDPIGKRLTHPLMNNEAFTIPQYLSVRNMEFYSGGADDDVARIMAGLGLLDKKPVHVRGKLVSPLDFIMSIMPPPPSPKELKMLLDRGHLKDGFFGFSIHAAARRNGSKRNVRKWVWFPTQQELAKKKIYSSFIGYAAGTCAAAFALEIPRVKITGVTAPEGLPRENRERVLRTIRKSRLISET